ncbi:protein FAM186B [Talpa occidentalis]|uniref:protein FAM186B n=1 Tax=Talpa occidentalis TaxID=50954 RepID=UPI00188F7662|nr:protein FAM186B [Talpa occidentalis]
MEKDEPPQLMTPKSVEGIVSRIEAAQLARAQEDISSQLSDILDNVDGVINRFQQELGYDLKEQAKSHQMEQKSKSRFLLLEKIASLSKDAKTKEKHLCEMLHWLDDWGDSLTHEIRNRKSEEEEESLDKWIQVMEKMLPLSLITTKGGIKSLISLCSTLIERQKKRAQMAKHNFWQDWQEKSPQVSVLFHQPLSPEQMLQDKQTTCTRVSEVKSMLQELLDSPLFNQGEVRAIKYISTMMENLNKAFILQHQENRSLETKYRWLKIEMTKELSSQRLYFQKSLHNLEKKRDALLSQVEVLEKKYHDLLLLNHASEFQLKKTQSARDQAKDLGKILDDSLVFPEKETPPKEERVMEDTQQEPKKEKQLFSSLSPSPMPMVWDGGVRPSTYQPLSIMTTCLRIADVYSSRCTESCEPLLLSSVDHKYPKKWETLEAENPDHKDQDQKDFFQGVAQEKERFQIKSHFREQLSPESPEKVAVQSDVEPWEEELSGEVQKQQWLEAEIWQQRLKKGPLLEQEHQEKPQQPAVEGVAREQEQRLVQPGKEQRNPRKELERPRESTEKMLFMPTKRWTDLKAEPPLAPPRRRAQSAGQGRRAPLRRPCSAVQTAPGNQRTKSLSELTQKPQAHQIPARPKNSASLPAGGTIPQKVTQPSLHITPITLKGRVYHMDTKAQRKNLQLLSEKAGLELPYYLRSKALELTTTAMELNALRLQCLCRKYTCYRHFQNLRQEVIDHIKVMRETGAPDKIQNLYIFLENIDHLENLQLQAWTDKQKALEETRQECLSGMAIMFPKLQLEWKIHLHTPLVTSPKSRKSKQPPSLTQGIHHSSASGKQLQERFPSKEASQQGNRMKAIWKTDVASSSHPIEKKTPVNLSWDQPGGHPDIPQLLAVGVRASGDKSVMSPTARDPKKAKPGTPR